MITAMNVYGYDSDEQPKHRTDVSIRVLRSAIRVDFYTAVGRTISVDAVDSRGQLGSNTQSLLLPGKTASSFSDLLG